MKHEALRIVFFGGFEKFSEVYSKALKDAGFEIVLEVKNKNADFESIGNRLRQLEPDLGIIAYFGKIVPRKILEIPKYGFLNVHPSLLPRWRGPSPVQTAILSGDKITGITIHLATEQFDAGNILAQKKVAIRQDDTCLNLTKRLTETGVKILAPTIHEWLDGEIKPKKQDHSKATYTKLIKKQDGEIDWALPAGDIEKMVRAYHPWPGAFTKLETRNSKLETLKIKKAEVVKNTQNLMPGQFFKATRFPTIACGEKALKLLVVHPEDRKEMPGDAFLRGRRELAVGEYHRGADGDRVFTEF